MPTRLQQQWISLVSFLAKLRGVTSLIKRTVGRRVKKSPKGSFRRAARANSPQIENRNTPIATDATRAQWRTQTGFLLAALGAAIGLGNIWRFSYVVGNNGGAAFLVIYLATIILVGLPMLIAELAVGRVTQREADSAFFHLGMLRGAGSVFLALSSRLQFSLITR